LISIVKKDYFLMIFPAVITIVFVKIIHS